MSIPLSRCFVFLVVYVFFLVWSATGNLLWPAGSYGLPKANTGCPVETGLTWKTGTGYQDCEDTDPQTTSSSSFHLDGFIRGGDVQRSFCMKDSTVQDYKRPSWPSGQYCIYQKSRNCPRGLQQGCVTWDDENVFSSNKNLFMGSLPRGKYGIDTTICFCCSTNGYWFKEIDLPLASPFYLIAYGSKQCQVVRGALSTLEYIYYETEFFSPVTKNNFWGAHPFGVSKTASGHTIYYCYYKPRYCTRFTSNPSNGRIVPERCMQKDMSTMNDTCSVQCLPGFTHKFSSMQTTQCQFNGRWTRSTLTDCVPVPVTTTTVPRTTQQSSTQSTLAPNTTVTSPNTSFTPTSLYVTNSKPNTEVTTVTEANGTTTQAGNTHSTPATTASGSTANISGSAQTTRTSTQSTSITKTTTEQSILGSNTDTRPSPMTMTGTLPGRAGRAVDSKDEQSSLLQHLAWAAGATFIAVMLVVGLLYRRRKKSNRKDVTVRMSSLEKLDSLDELASESFVNQRSTADNSPYPDHLIMPEVEEYQIKSQDNVLYESFTPMSLTRSSSNILYESLSQFEAAFTNHEEEEPFYINYKSVA